jgi:hypothetical protein
MGDNAPKMAHLSPALPVVGLNVVGLNIVVET